MPKLYSNNHLLHPVAKESNSVNAQEIVARLAADVHSGEVIFPTTAEMALKIHRVLDDPECLLDKLARMAQAEPMLAARVVAVESPFARLVGDAPNDNRIQIEKAVDPETLGDILQESEEEVASLIGALYA
jgi:hypothetical protein